MVDFGARTVLSFVLRVGGPLLVLLGLVAFNLGYIFLYVASLPLLCVCTVLSLEVHEDFFLSLLLLATTSTLLYAIGLFALPVVACGLLLSLPLVVLFRHWQSLLPASLRLLHRERFGWGTVDLCGLLLLALFVRYLLYRAGGGVVPLRIGEFESFSRFLIGEVGGWSIFAFGYGLQPQRIESLSMQPEEDFSSSVPSLLASGLFLVSPHVVILTLGLNLFGVTGFYVGLLPVGAAYVLMRTLRRRRLALEQQNLHLQQLNLELARSGRLAAVGEMSAAISHQLLQKVGLVGLQGALLRDLLWEESVVVAEQLREGRERAELLDESIADLNSTLSDLLVFSKDVSLQVEDCEMASFLRDLVQEVQALLETKNITVVFQQDGDASGMPVSIDRIKMTQALLNVLKNAVEASPPRGQISLVLRSDADELHILVADQGPGVTQVDAERIFVPFFSTKAQGTGLGLSFAQKIVALHGGTLTACNNASGGATFVFTLPKGHHFRE